MGNAMSSFPVVIPIRDRGVRLEVARKVVNELSDEHYNIAKKKLGKDPSPGEVIVHGYVKEISQGESLAEYLLHDPNTAALVGRSNVFLSHTWGTPFASTVTALDEYESQLSNEAPDCYYFIDLFSINQFHALQDLNELGDLAKSSETLVLYSRPWNKPVALQRAWCIFELAHGVLGGTNLVLAMSKEEKGHLKKAVMGLKSNFHAVKFLENFSKIDSSNMKASFPKDLKMIEDFMQEKMRGFHSVDQLVSSSMRNWVGQTAKYLCESFSDNGTEEHVHFLLSAGYLFTLIGRLDYKLESLQLAREICEQLNLKWLLVLTMNSEAIALERLGRYDEAAELYQKALEFSIKNYGLDHQNTLDFRENLGDLYKTMKKWNEAEKELTVTLAAFKKLQSPMSVDIRSSQSSLAEVLRDSGKDVKRAQLLFKEMLDYETKAFGAEDDTVLITLADHARCLALQGDQRTALKSYIKALPILVKTYGEDFHFVKKLRAWMSELPQDLEGKTDL